MRRRPRRRGTGRHPPAEVNITAFMNLMVILVPFLLVTAVFSRITILELDLPGAAGNAQPESRRFDLEIIVRGKAIEVGERYGGTIRRIDATASGYDYAQLSQVLQQIKARFPETLDATLLLEADISYDTLVQVMDCVRVARIVQAGGVYNTELFPGITIGDAPGGGMQVVNNHAGRVQ